ncbi:MAG TPA: NAD(P)H-hydrate epimerase, partial [Leptospiraceae bacterium]|nr:NAD(P)H-hydrate epimerase [Leptospiraceae bacterium]
MKPLLTKILNVSQIRSLDAFTIENEPVASIDLMERASIAFVKWFTAHFDSEFSIRIFVGPGNNGGDGLAIGRLLSQEKYKVEIYIPTYDQDRSKDFLINYNRLPHNVKRVEINSTKEIEPAKNNTIIIDALLGSGLNRKPKGIIEDVISYINQSGFIIISVDIASGLFADKHTDHSSIVNPNYTISFQIPKLAFFFPDNSKYVGNWQLVDIGLSK